jgi:hypothetical protein
LIKYLLTGKNSLPILSPSESNVLSKEVFELTSVLGIHTLNVSVPILVEELKATGKEVGF